MRLIIVILCILSCIPSYAKKTDPCIYHESLSSIHDQLVVTAKRIERMPDNQEKVYLTLRVWEFFEDVDTRARLCVLGVVYPGTPEYIKRAARFIVYVYHVTQKKQRSRK